MFATSRHEKRTHRRDARDPTLARMV
jgi:hypothetical protein